MIQRIPRCLTVITLRQLSALSDPTLTCDALYGLGTAHLRAEQYSESENAFTRHINECEASFRALILRGQTREGLENAAGAIADYEQAIATNPGLLDSYLYQRMAAVDLDRSVNFLRLATEAQRQPEGMFVLREQVAQVFLLLGGIDAAKAQYETVLREIDAYLGVLDQIEGAAFDRDGVLRARLESTLAELEIDMGETQAGYARLQKVITEYTETPSALPALITLVSANQPVDLLIRMRVNVLNENYFPVVDVLTETLRVPSEDTPAELYLLLGKAQRGQGDIQAALATFVQARELPEIAPAALLEQALTYTESGDTANAIAIYTQIPNEYPESAEAPQALPRAADLQQAAGEIEAAATLYTQLVEQYPDSEEAQEDLFDATLVLADSDPARAASLFGSIGTGEGYLWQGKLLTDETAARQAWTAATTSDPGSFFAMRACALLNDLQPFTPSDTVEIQPITDEDRMVAAAWVEETFGVADVTVELAPQLAENPLLRRGTELHAVGLWDEARAEFDALHKQQRGNPAALLQLAFYYESIGVYRSALFSATRLTFASGVPLSRVPRAVLQLAYPFYYTDLFIAEAEKYGLDPLMIAALVRQETSFDVAATSIANARGLMQLLPLTAQEVANQLQLTDYTLSDLYRPVVNIPLGVRYFNNMRDFQGGSLAGALLSYNAGPGAAQRWLSNAGNDVDRLYETIDFNETQLYLELIYQNYTVYQHLYGGGVPSCMFEGGTS